jgi:DNA-binding NtrC family response regulator
MRPTALLVDDDATTLVALPDLLNCRLPHLRVETTTDVVDALARLDIQHYSVVLTDLRMPRMDGLTFLQEVKRRQVETPVVLMTGISDATLATLAVEAGAFDFLSKPLDRDDLATTIQLAVTASRLLRDMEASQQRLRRYGERLRRLKDKAPSECAPDVMQLISDVQAEVGVVSERVWESSSLVQRTKTRLLEKRKLLESVQRVARQREQERAVRRMLLG